MLKKICAVLGVAVVLLAGVLLGRAVRFASKQVVAEPAALLPVDAHQAAAGLAEAIRFRTISHQEPTRLDEAQFAGLHAFLAKRFPALHRALKREVVNDYSLLYAWPGRDGGDPVVWLAHLDVVPVEAATEAAWTHPPFAGTIADGYVWGRGALDDKGNVMAMLEAVERLVEAGFRPTRTVYLAFGHDEEAGGHDGAAVIAARLRDRGVRAEYVLDEGGMIEGLIPGVPGVVAMVGVAEKGYVSVELTAAATGGHSSMPPPHTAVGLIGRAIQRLEQHQVPGNLAVAVQPTFEYLGPEMPLALRVVFANLWLFGPLVEWQLSQDGSTNAVVRTTTAPTVVEGGVKDNVLPASARAVVNFRILPGDTVDGVLAHVRRVVDDPAVSARPLGGANNPSPVSPAGAPPYAALARAIRAVFPNAVVAPSLILGATDARHYAAITDNIYRFAPVRLRKEDLARIHGIDERIGVEDYAVMIRFYGELLRRTAGQASAGDGHLASGASSP